ncbi:MAG: A/G-specific adenine glycosylase [Promethearchaeota archaeon]
MNILSSIDKKRIIEFSPKLRDWFVNNGRDLPWRKTRNPYKILVSEIMAQQTQLKNVIPIYKRFLKRYPTITELANSNIEDLRQITDNLGYKRRGDYLHEIAKILVEKKDGKIPDTLEELLELPGIGKYTAGAILSFSYEKRVPIVDVNVERVLGRFFNLQTNSGTAEHEKTLWALADALMPDEKQGRTIWEHNQGIMELGALICVSGKPKCLLCPINEICEYYASSVKQLTLDSFFIS